MATKVDYHAYMASREWRLKRKEVIKQCGNICQRCGNSEVQNIHHASYKNVGHEEYGDLAGLCRPCHEFVSAERADDPGAIAVWEYIKTLGIQAEVHPDGGLLWWHLGPSPRGVHFMVTFQNTPDIDPIVPNDLATEIVIPFIYGVWLHAKWF